MSKQLQEIKDYLQEVLGFVADVNYWSESWPDDSQLPFYLQSRYTFSQAEILGKPCLLMICRGSSGETPAIVSKHWAAVNDRFDGDVVYVVEGVSSYNRKRLIEQRVPFIVPRNQLYIPMLGIDLRERFKQSKMPEKQWLSAVAQLLVLREILGLESQALSAKELANVLGYSAMTLTRAINELVDRELATAEMVGRRKSLKFNYTKQELWLKAKPNLYSPVKKQVWVAKRHLDNLIKGAGAKVAGESALAEFTMIAHPKHQILAINASEWPGVKKLMDIEALNERDFDSVALQLWRYSPTRVCIGELVDPLSLWLSFENTSDERIEMARDNLLGQALSKSL